MLKLTALSVRTAAMAILIGSAAFATPTFAQTSGMSSQAPSEQSDQNSTDQGTTSGANVGGSQAQAIPAHMHGAQKIEARIKTLHDKLKITAAEENDWNAVAQTMRDNETTISQSIQERHQNAESMTAVDDLQSYQKITQAHADGLQKLISSFETVYNDMSNAQKKNADAVFGSFEGRHGMGQKTHHS